MASEGAIVRKMHRNHRKTSRKASIMSTANIKPSQDSIQPSGRLLAFQSTVLLLHLKAPDIRVMEFPVYTRTVISVEVTLIPTPVATN